MIPALLASLFGALACVHYAMAVVLIIRNAIVPCVRQLALAFAALMCSFAFVAVAVTQ